jgi:hypothetical protein
MKHVLVTFDLTEASSEQYKAAYRVLAGLGLTAVQNNILLPTTSVIGVWWEDNNAAEIRWALLNALLNAGVRVDALAVAIFAEAAWWRSAR